MHPAIRIFPVFLLAALAPLVCAAGEGSGGSPISGKYGWFNDPLGGDSTVKNPSAVGMEVYRSSDGPRAETGALSAHRISLFGDYSTRTDYPRYQRAFDDADQTVSRRLANFGVRWQHRVSARDSISVSAEQGDSSMVRPALTSNAEGSDMRATLAWTRELPWEWKPTVTGGVFLGDETAHNEASRFLGRRYFGFAVGGELRLLESHRPYVSFRMQRSLYDVPGEENATSGAAPSRYTANGDYSRFAAGWRWQASRGMSLQAEASYGINFNNNPDVIVPLEREHSRVFFGTRFDFR